VKASPPPADATVGVPSGSAVVLDAAADAAAVLDAAVGLAAAVVVVAPEAPLLELAELLSVAEPYGASGHVELTPLELSACTTAPDGAANANATTPATNSPKIKPIVRPVVLLMMNPLPVVT
jgi:hypothetical protein